MSEVQHEERRPHPAEALGKSGNGKVSVIARSRLELPAAIAKEYEISAPDWRVLIEQIFPSARTVEAVLLALAYCKRRNLDIFKKPVHIVPMWSSALGKMVETVWPGIAEIRTTAMRTRDYAGIDEVVFGPVIEREFSGKVKIDKQWKTVTKKVRFPEWASVTVYRLDRTDQVRAFKAKIFWLETYATMGQDEVPNEMWETRAYGQLDKCVEAAALRKAFPEELGNTYSAEEMEGKTIDVTPAPREAPPAPPPPAKESGPTIDASQGSSTARADEQGGRSPPAPEASPIPAPTAEELDDIPAAFDRRPGRSAAPYDPRNARETAEDAEEVEEEEPVEIMGPGQFSQYLDNLQGLYEEAETLDEVEKIKEAVDDAGKPRMAPPDYAKTVLLYSEARARVLLPRT